MSHWDYLNQHRVRFGALASTPDLGFNGAFMISLPGEARKVCIIASDAHGWKHVSVSFGRASQKTPSWEVMSQVKELFFDPDEWVVQFHPPKLSHINIHPGCLHLWCSTACPMPTPDPAMV